MIPPINFSHPAYITQTSKTPLPAEIQTSEPLTSAEDQGQLTLTTTSLPEPQRSASTMPEWRHDYESQLSISPRGLEARERVLREGGPSMLYRMYPLLFQQDLKGTYREMAQLLPGKAPKITLTGDCHTGNFGTSLDSGNDLVWGLNDYDQAGQGCPQSDLCRAGASLALLCRQRGWSQSVMKKLITAFVHGYTESISKFCQQQPDPITGIHKHQADGPVHQLLKKVERHTQEALLSKWTDINNQGQLQFKHNDDLHQLDESQQIRLNQLLHKFHLPSNTQILDSCSRWEAGGSSLGLERYYLLVKKNGQSLANVLEIKQVLPCALATEEVNPQKCDPQLLQDGFKWLGAPRDPWQQIARGDNGVYLLRERQRVRGSVATEELNHDDAISLARQMGQVVAQAQANGSNPQNIHNWINNQESLLTEKLLQFSSTYADQTIQDYQALFPQN